MLEPRHEALGIGVREERPRAATEREPHEHGVDDDRADEHAQAVMPRLSGLAQHERAKNGDRERAHGPQRVARLPNVALPGATADESGFSRLSSR